ncbi:MAG: Uma2 family endonuclease [Chloroflexota bacterium]|nr:Uma2 family endonuclease [Chloroflexota bacterium]
MAAVESRARLLTLKDYLALPEDNGLEREIIRGRLFVPPRPRILHQHLLGELFELLRGYIRQRGGHTIQVILDADLLMDTLNTYLSPDLMYFPAEAVPTLLDLMARGHRIHLLDARPELVVEVLSPQSEEHDLVEKQAVYAEAGIPHYWVFDPQEQAFGEFVLDPERGTYVEHWHEHGAVRPRLFADAQPPFTLELPRLWPAGPYPPA